MSDIADQASELEQLLRDAALAAIEYPCGHSLSHCEDCGEPIPLARRQAVPGCRRCVDCQAFFELRCGMAGGRP